MRPIQLIFIFFIVFFFALSASAQHKILTERFSILDSGRILDNPPFKNCHAVTISQTGRDTLLYAWFGGDHEGANNVCIWGCFRYLKNKHQWTKVIKLADAKNSEGLPIACWNPVAFFSKSGQLFLDYKAGANPREWWAMRKVSFDHGKTWSEATRLPDEFLGPIRNKPIQLANGNILYPSSTESKDEKKWLIHMEISDQYGHNWKRIVIDCDSFGVIQPTILQYPNNRLQMLCRSRQNVIVQTWSFDNGMTWSKLKPISLPNPNSGIDGVTLHNGLQMLVYNPMVSGNDWWIGRAILKVAISFNGKDWKEILTLENHEKGEYSYPAIIEDSEHRVHIAYTDDRKNIKFVDLSAMYPKL